MLRVVGVRFRKAGKIYYFSPGDLDVRPGERVIVETARGLECGEVALGPRDVDESEIVPPLKTILRVATPEDDRRVEENRRRQRDAFRICLEKIEAYGLPMTLLDAEYTFDRAKLIFSFSAEGRVDFRGLVRDLAAVFRTRIEMRQVGVRDEAKLLGGIGPCGRVLCCSSFLTDFAPVSIRMAKDQNLTLNPGKISGLCGRLKCCLRYEQDTYEAAKTQPELLPAAPPPLFELDAAPDEETVAALASAMEETPATGAAAAAGSSPPPARGKGANRRRRSRRRSKGATGQVPPGGLKPSGPGS